MNRRSALKLLSIASGGGMLLTPAMLSGCSSSTYQPVFFAAEALPLINEIGETILPETPDSPGAKAIQVANFMDKMVADCFTPEHQTIVRNGLLSFQQRCHQEYANEFSKLSGEQRHQLLVEIDREAKAAASIHYFSLLKSLVLFSFFTSETVSTQVLRYVPIPGTYIGDYPLEEEDTAWAL